MGLFEKDESFVEKHPVATGLLGTLFLGGLTALAAKGSKSKTKPKSTLSGDGAEDRTLIRGTKKK